MDTPCAMLCTLNTILPHARRNGYAIPAFNINNLEICQSVIDAANGLKSPVILQTSQGALQYAGMDYLAAIAHVAAHSVPIPVVFHLDHGTDANLVKTAIKSGLYTSVMYDGSRLAFKHNVTTTRGIVKLAHARGLSVEAELGPIAGSEDTLRVQDRDAFFTDPQQAEIFVKETGCDALAVSIGTAHGAYKGAPQLDLKRLAEISKRIHVPMVLHGASGIGKKWLARLHALCEKHGDCGRLAGAEGISLSQEKKAIKLGIAKINIDSDLRIAFTAAVRKTLLTDTHVFDPRKILEPARAAMTALAKEKIRAFGSAGRG